MTLKKLLSPLGLLSMTLVLSLASCSKTSELISTIPADTQIVVKLNPAYILEKTGCKLSGTSITISDEWKHIKDAEIGLTKIAEFNDAIDLKQIFLLTDMEANNAVITFPVKNLADFKAKTEDVINWNDAVADGDYQSVDLQGATLVVTGKQGWMLPTVRNADRAIEVVKQLLENAKKEHIGRFSGVADALGDDDAFMACAIHTALGDRNIVSACKGSVNGNDLVFTSENYDENGKPCEMPGIEKINDAVLAYVPSSFIGAAAAGIGPDFPWGDVADYVNKLGDRELSQGMAIALPFLKALNGTILVAAGPTSETSFVNPTPQNWQALAMVHFTQEKTDDIMNMISAQLPNLGMPFTTKDGVISIDASSQGLGTLYVGVVDGYLAAANVPFEQNRQNELAPYFNGKCGAFYLELPRLSSINPVLPSFGVKIVAESSVSKGKTVISLPGTDKNVLATLLEVASQYQALLR